MALRIGTSCSASLDEMPRTPSGRRCTNCDRDVLDLRYETEARAVAIALLLGGSAPCARLRVDWSAIRASLGTLERLSREMMLNLID